MEKRKAINVPVSKEQEEIIKKKAKEKGMTVAAYLRYMAMYVGVEK
jgi:predicted DNA binding CopG/RHH family protein